MAVARALVASPSLVLADEPTGNLDSATTEAVMSMFADLHQTGITLAVITHDLEVADGAERQIHIRDGVVSNGVGSGVGVGLGDGSCSHDHGDRSGAAGSGTDTAERV